MSILQRAEKRRADFIEALARDPDNGLEELLELYWWWGSDTVDFFIEKFGQKLSLLKNLSDLGIGSPMKTATDDF